MNLKKLRPSHVHRVLRARRRWLWRSAEDRLGVVVRRWPVPGTAAWELRRVIQLRDVTVVVDVGAHEGGFGATLRRMGYAGPIVSFEPASAAFAVLRRRVAPDSNWSIHQFALGYEPASMELDIYDQTQLNSLRPLRADQHSRRDGAVGVETVVVRRLDDIWDEAVGTPYQALLKVDAQGFDLDVLRGAESSLTRCGVVQVEVSGSSLYEGTPPLHEVVSYLYDRSFRVTGLFPIARWPHDPAQVIDFDAIFVRVDGEGP